MQLFTTTLSQTGILFSFIIIGYILAKTGYLPENAGAVLSKLESAVFIPALILGTFIKQFTLATFSTAWKLMLFSLVCEAVVIPLGILLARLSVKDVFRESSIHTVSAFPTSALWETPL